MSSAYESADLLLKLEQLIMRMPNAKERLAGMREFIRAMAAAHAARV